MNRVLALILVLVTSSASAAPDAYHCQVRQHLEQSVEGDLRPARMTYMEDRRFSVDRSTGRVVGLSNLFAHAETRFQVLARGNRANDFLSIASTAAAKDGLHLAAIRVKEYADGPQKPFIVMMNGEVVSGFCE